MALEKNQRYIVVIVTVCAVLVYWFVRFAIQNEESRLRKFIYSAVVMVENEDMDSCASLISSDYKDSYGNDRKEILILIEKTFRDFCNFKINIKNIKIEIHDSRATANIGFVVYFKVKDEEQFYYDSGKMALSLKKEKRAWEITSMEYTGSNELLFMNAVA